MSRVVITGLGAITPIGNTVSDFWENLKHGVSGAARIQAFDPEAYSTQIACEVKDFNPTDFIDRKTVRRIARPTQFGVAAAHQALADAGLSITANNAPDIGVSMNTGGGGVYMLEDWTRVLDERGPRAVGPFAVTGIMANAASCVVSIETGAMGPVLTSTLACASGNYALIEAYHMIQRGDAKAMIAGGTEACISEVISAAFARIQATSQRNHDPARASRPFDGERDGFVPAEGAAAVLMEREEDALARGAHIYAEVLGGRLTGDAYHVTAPRPDGEGAIRAMRGAIAAAGLTTDDVDVIYAHGTSTPLNDATETEAIKAVFGERAYQLPISAPKSMLGHSLGSAGALAALAAVLGFQHDIIPPTINHDTPDPACDLDYVPNVARQQRSNVALVNAFGFGGQNVVLVLKRYTA